MASVVTPEPARVVHRLDGLSAFLPVRNEVESLAPTATALLGVLPRVAARWELIIVDDGSRDGTGSLAAGLARCEPGVRVVTHARSQGYGAAVRAGLRAARYEWIFFTDGDGQFDPTELTRLTAALGGADGALGYRRARADPFGRRLLGQIWSLLARLVFDVPARDVNCAFKLLRRELLAGLELRSTGAAISIELLARMRRRGASLTEVGVAHRPRRHGTASGANADVILRAGPELVRLWRALRRPAGR